MRLLVWFNVLIALMGFKNALAQDDRSNIVEEYNLWAIGAKIGYSYEKESFLTPGVGLFYIKGLFAVEAGYHYKLGFSSSINGHEGYFNVGVGLPPYRWASAAYVMLGGSYHTMTHATNAQYQYVRPELGLLVPAGIVLKRRQGGRHQLAFTVKASYGYHVFLNNPPQELGNHAFIIGLLCGYGVSL